VESETATVRKAGPDWRTQLEQRVLAPLAANSRGYFVWLAALLVVIAWAVYAYIQQAQNGLIVTGMRDRISWGLYIANFVFFIGISHVGMLLSAILRVTKAHWQMSITRMAELITIAALFVAALFPFIDLGRPDRILNIAFYGRWQSPLLWDIFAITTYLTGSLIYLYLLLIPDFALCRDRLGPSVAAWKRQYFTLLALGWHGSAEQHGALNRAVTIMMIVIIPVAVSVHTVVSWIFAMTLRSPFNSTVFGVFFVAGAIYSGIAAVILLMAALRWLLHLEAYITQKHFVNLGYLLATLALIMGYLNLTEYITTGYKMEEGIWFYIQQLTIGPFAPLFWFNIFGGIFIPGLIILFSRTRNIRGIIIASVLVLSGMWIERYLIVVAGFRVPLMSYLPRDYAPTWVEWSILAGAFALFALLISVFVKLIPVISIWEVVEEHELEESRAPQTAVPHLGAAGATLSMAAAPSRAAVPAGTPQPPNRKGNARLSRREALRSFGLLGAVGLGAPTLGLMAASRVKPAKAADSPAGQRLRRWAMVIDLRHCDGCQAVGKPPQCTAACIQGHLAPEPMEWIQVYEDPLPGGGTQFVPTPCQQCQNAPCLNVCPVGATFSTPEGPVLIDQSRCIGCRICMEACPYDRRFFNWGDAPIPTDALFMEYDPEHQTPAARGTVMKCDFCPDMARAGRLPYCVQACPNNAIYYGDLEEDVATNRLTVVKLSRFLTENSTSRLKEHLGTEPRVYYIAGHGELVGREAYQAGRMPTVWPWQKLAKGGQKWAR
jgi:Fe-S-cluster-containing dehydrogenase component/Ni/Fe-hydrogenase subunit HybB-like protein